MNHFLNLFSLNRQIKASNHQIKDLWCNNFFIKRSKTGPWRWCYNLSFSREENHNIFPKTKISKQRVPWRWRYNLPCHREANHNIFPKKHVSKKSRRDYSCCRYLHDPSKIIQIYQCCHTHKWKSLEATRLKINGLSPTKVT